jgi:hypothetical protein
MKIIHYVKLTRADGLEVLILGSDPPRRISAPLDHQPGNCSLIWSRTDELNVRETATEVLEAFGARSSPRSR